MKGPGLNDCYVTGDLSVSIHKISLFSNETSYQDLYLTIGDELMIPYILRSGFIKKKTHTQNNDMYIFILDREDSALILCPFS